MTNYPYIMRASFKQACGANRGQVQCRGAGPCVSSGSAMIEPSGKRSANKLPLSENSHGAGRGPFIVSAFEIKEPSGYSKNLESENLL